VRSQMMQLPSLLALTHSSSLPEKQGSSNSSGFSS
jgi:hypothetical protein